MPTDARLCGDALTVDIPHRRLAAKQWGRPSNPPVLALHGWLDNAASFDRLAPLLADRYVVALDLPGHGLSQHYPPGTLYGIVDVVADIIAVIEALGWPRLALLGHSLGAGISPLVAATVPDRIERVALLDGLGPLTDDEDAAPDRFARSLTFQRQRSGRLRSFASLEEATQRWADVAAPLRLDSAELLVRRGVEPDEVGRLRWRSDPALRVPSRQRLTERQVHAFLRRVTCPTLLVHTNTGFSDARARLPDRMACVDKLESHLVEGGHHVHLDDAELVAGFVAPFLAVRS